MATLQLSLFEQFRFRDSSLTDEQVVEAIARQLLSEADAAPPVDIDILASLCGIATVEYNAQIPAGMLFQRDGRLVASVRAGDGLERGRFTALHEGGHTFQKGFGRATRYRCWGAKTREEHLCDVAAAEMLFPRRHFLADLKEFGTSLEAVGSLASTYIASLQATALRLVALNPHPIALLVFKYARKPSESGREDACPPRLRLQWTSTQGTWPYLRIDKSVSDGSLIARAWQGEFVDELGNIGEVAGPALGQVRIEARRYGDTVLTLAHRLPFGRR
jgi:hypothetical protein